MTRAMLLYNVVEAAERQIVFRQDRLIWLVTRRKRIPCPLTESKGQRVMEPWVLHAACRMAFPPNFRPLLVHPTAAFSLTHSQWVSSYSSWQPMGSQVDPSRVGKFDRAIAPQPYDVYAGPYGDFFALWDTKVWRIAPAGTRFEYLFDLAEGAELPKVITEDGKQKFLEKLYKFSSGMNAIEQHPLLPPWEWRKRVGDILGPGAQLMQPAENHGATKLLKHGAFLTFQHRDASAPYLVSRLGSNTVVESGVKGTKLRSLAGLDLEQKWHEVERQLTRAIGLGGVPESPYELAVVVADGRGGHLSLSYPNVDGPPQWEHAGNGRSWPSDFKPPPPGPSVKIAAETAAWLASQSWDPSTPKPDWSALPGQVFAGNPEIAAAIVQEANSVPRAALGMRRVGGYSRPVTRRPGPGRR